MDADNVAEAVLASAPATFENASVWRNISSWTAQHLGYAMNVSKFAPSFEDLVLAGPRMVMRLGSFIPFPEAIDGFGQRVVPESTDPALFHATTTSFAGTVTQTTQSVAESILAEQDPNAFVSRFTLESAKGLGSVFSYATSKWALSCVVMAVVINRTTVFAATRRRPHLDWKLRLALRMIPIVLLFWQARTLLQSIQCQTSPDFAELRWGNASKSSDLMFSQTNGFLHGLSSSLLLGASDEDSCKAIHMVPQMVHEQTEMRGSLSRLWPVFKTLCASQFVELLSCTIQGRPAAVETGMTLFEHSLAFAEADAAVSNQLGWGLFANGTMAPSSNTNTGAVIAVTRSMILSRVNTSPEVLLVAFLSAMSHASSHILGIFNLQSKCRLVNTAFWALSFMGCIVWSAMNFSLEDTSSQGLLRYPTVCIIGFIPHVMVLFGILICGGIYCAAVFFSALAISRQPGDGEPVTFAGRLARAHSNMQVNVSLSDIRIRLDVDFYTALLRAGFGAVTMASEAVYLNEDHRVNLAQQTWLDGERLREIEELKMQWGGGGVAGSRLESVGMIGLVPVKDGPWSSRSGYAREKAAQKLPKNGGAVRRIRDGVGASERSSRWLMALEYFIYVVRLFLVTCALGVIKALGWIGIRNHPRWLTWFVPGPKQETAGNQQVSQRELGTPDWVSLGGRAIRFSVPRTDRVDVEAELRVRLQRGSSDVFAIEESAPVDETEMDASLYSWWARGGWWGNIDTSGDYNPPINHDPDNDQDDTDFDTTSVISVTETAPSESGWESEPDDGHRTPTQRSPNPFAAGASSYRVDRESSPLLDTPIAMDHLARLLRPSNPEEREEAATLAAHFGSDRIMTRSRYQAHQQRQRVQVLLSNRNRFGVGGQTMSQEDEAAVLEQILLSRRAAAPPATPSAGPSGGSAAGFMSGMSSSSPSASTWATGAPGLGPDGPQCVVCQSAPRTIIVWPCRCLSLCDDCRVSLAMNNFDKCVCCRREVISFSRIYVP